MELVGVTASEKFVVVTDYLVVVADCYVVDGESELLSVKVVFDSGGIWAYGCEGTVSSLEGAKS